MDLTTTSRHVIVAHRSAVVRERFAAALGDAQHQVSTAESASATLQLVSSAARRSDLALVDFTLSDDGMGFVRAIRQRTSRAFPIVVFAGSVPSTPTVLQLATLDVAYVNEHVLAPSVLQALSPYLFPDTFNRRSSARVRVGVPVSYKSGQTIAAAVTLDVGKGGVNIRTMEPLARGGAVQVRFKLPGASHDIEAAGRVVWADRRRGMGVQFEQVSSNDQRAIDAFVEASIELDPADLRRWPS